MIKKAYSLFFKGLRKVYYIILSLLDKLRCQLLFYGNRVNHRDYKTKGLPYLMVARGGEFLIGENFRMNNTIASNPIGCAQPCMFFVDRNAKLIIGDHVSMSQSALVCHVGITIGDYVKIGGGVCIYDTDFHSLDAKIRRDSMADMANKKKLPVVIHDNVFIGAHSKILKGVTIGENSIIGASAVVTKDIPANEIWGGNPAKKIKSII
ncbi:acyltransferase [Maribacter luteus]|uniref:Acyltransferase n=1 Tax=Maribacter luteus TaxID=2594478 RepID=A0A6I2MHN4_9FLAO|nr:acyltransferase [Maribacter luteus]MRX63333.1 acyltransferase [Maribacter luteus]